ncbi:MAG: type I secretion protein, partial [Rhodobacteraceae bacterium]|nr:type I secretion protein [Paracoccaceae bacterium]
MLWLAGVMGLMAVGAVAFVEIEPGSEAEEEDDRANDVPLRPVGEILTGS